eukprot:TRINITY_DN54130_c0_g1_i1.p1 TRINITY_DN54130_c0_g1~~TRINITY_DN54130_c0_g1_i1.p1  ORF type:complete len:149 (-),score=44.48 TRINITY_DN54130_c0_g1_i1:71-472(-)
MLRSLVGSEMCIRDRFPWGAKRQAAGAVTGSVDASQCHILQLACAQLGREATKGFQRGRLDTAGLIHANSLLEEVKVQLGVVEGDRAATTEHDELVCLTQPIQEEATEHAGVPVSVGEDEFRGSKRELSLIHI